MLALEARSAVVMGCSIPQHSQIANIQASPKIRKPCDATIFAFSHYANMVDEDDKNGGPNHLKAWMRFRKVSGAGLAKELDITPGMVSDLANSNRALSACSYLGLRILFPTGSLIGSMRAHDSRRNYKNSQTAKLGLAITFAICE